MTAPSQLDEHAAFAREVHLIRVSWVLWRRLFNRGEDGETSRQRSESGEEAYRVTGATSKLFFIHARWHMLSGVIAHISRMADRLRTAGRDNLTAQRVFEATDFSSSPGQEFIARNYLRHFLKVVHKPDGIFELRHKALAHLDLDYALGRSGAPQVDIDDIDLAKRALVAFERIVTKCHAGEVLALRSREAEPDRNEELAWEAEVDRLVEVLGCGLDVGTR